MQALELFLLHAQEVLVRAAGIFRGAGLVRRRPRPRCWQAHTELAHVVIEEADKAGHSTWVKVAPVVRESPRVRHIGFRDVEDRGQLFAREVFRVAVFVDHTVEGELVARHDSLEHGATEGLANNRVAEVYEADVALGDPRLSLCRRCPHPSWQRWS